MVSSNLNREAPVVQIVRNEIAIIAFPMDFQSIKLKVIMKVFLNLHYRFQRVLLNLMVTFNWLLKTIALQGLWIKISSFIACRILHPCRRKPQC